MKQQITIEQYQELSELAQFRLKQWEQDKGIDTLLSIGQMNEFLDEHDWRVGNKFIGRYITKLENSWAIGEEDSSQQWDSDYEAEELCDTLWKAVKEILNQVDNIEKKV